MTVKTAIMFEDAVDALKLVNTANPLPVTMVPEATVNLTGDVVVDTLGALNNAAVVDPAAASATIPSLLRGELTELLALKAVIGAIDDAAWVSGNGTLISLLKTIATNTASAG